MKKPNIETYRVCGFLRDKSYFIIAAIVVSAIAGLFLRIFRVRATEIIVLTVLWLGFLSFVLITEYWRKRNFYRDLLKQIAELDQAYYVLETLSTPNFYDGEILCAALYQINKSMAENVNQYRVRSQEFQEYIEMWIHEVKTPLATLALISHDTQVNEQIKRLNDYVEQILYCVRAENSEQDYLFAACNLAEIINHVASRNREILQAKQINLQVENLEQTIHTDAKWLEFIINQIINNSIKYQSRNLKIAAKNVNQKVILTLRDDGLGIAAKDLPRVFDKSFTGDNGRIGAQSTGMGLYIAKTLCDKLGHKISITSEKSKYAEVQIEFAESEYYHLLHAK